MNRTDQPASCNHFIDAYIAELNLNVSREELMGEAAVLPIELDGQVVGIFGLNKTVQGGEPTIVVRFIYIDKPFRHRKYLDRAHEELLFKAWNQGARKVEVWATPKLARWIERTYQVQPEAYVYNEQLSHIVGKIEDNRK